MTTLEEQARSIFLAALDREPDQWPAFLEEACGGSAELRKRVEQLLDAHQAMGSIHARRAEAPVVTVDEQPITERPSTVIGPYKLLELIGEGGMGTVWMAQQTEPVKRVVALKLIKAGMDSRQVIARFEAERQALALMDHANIARVLDAGTTKGEPGGVSPGRPYFVMDLVKGVPITRYCDEHHLTPRQRLELFIPVCQAVQHAHQKGIIHRDLKPSNVLVALYDGKPVPKVIDFGVAKAAGPSLTEKTLVTGFGAIVGTLEYMSPEQAEINQLDIDTRSDIYSLGVLLYELLTGSPPFTRKELEKAGMLEMLRVIREQEPSKPSTKLSTAEGLPTLAANRGTEPAKLTKLVRGELDWIVMKALEKDRNRRYETANGFARDVQRYLNDEPVLACPPSVGYRLRKLLRRNRGPVLAASLVFLALVGGIVGTTLGLIAAQRQRDAANNAAAAETKAKETAMTREAEIQAVLKFVESKIFAAAKPAGQDGGLGRDVTLRRALEEALPFVETSFKDQPLIEARLRKTLGEAFWRLDEAQIAAEQCEKARALYTKHLGPDHPLTIGSWWALANTYSALHRHADALQLREAVWQRSTDHLGPDHFITLQAMDQLAGSYSALGRNAEALKLFEETVALMKVKIGPDDPNTLTAMDNLAVGYTRAGRLDEALKLHEQSHALLKEKYGPEHPETLMAKNNLSCCYAALGRHAEAVKLGEETVTLRKAKLGPGHRHTLISMGNLAEDYEALARLDEALKVREEILVIRKAKLGADHPETFTSMFWLAVAYDRLGRYAEAIKLHEETLSLRKTRLGRDHADTVASMISLAYTCAAVNRWQDALKLYEEALAISKVKLGPHHRDTLVCMNNIAGCYKDLGRTAEALKLQEDTLKLRKTHLGPDDADTLFSMNQLAQWYTSLNRHADAARLLEEWLPIQKAKFGADHANTLKNMHDLAYCFGVLGRQEDCLKLIEQRLALMKAKLGLHHRDTLVAMYDRADRYAKFGRDKEALKLREELVPLMKANLGPQDPDTLGSMNDLALSHVAFGRHAEAAKLNEETLAIMKRALGPDHDFTLLNMGNLANNYTALGRHAEALKLRQELLALRKGRLGPDHPETLWSMGCVAESLVVLGRGAEALVLIDDCLKRAGSKEVDPNLIPFALELRLDCFEIAKDAAGCRATAEMWEKLNRTDSESLYGAAWMRAKTAAVLKNALPPGPNATRLINEQADRAMAWLKQAAAAGYTNAALLSQDKALDILRDRQDFRKLLAELEAKKK